MSKLLFLNIDEIKNNNYINNIFPDIYFTEKYGIICEYSDNAIWECCLYQDLIYIYLKKKIICGNIEYYDLITPYGYSGFYYENSNTFNTFLILFREEAFKKNYITEVLRQSPYLGINIDNYDIITKKTTYGIFLYKYSNIEDYLKNSSKNNKRMVKKAIDNNLSFDISNLNNDNINKFKKIYESTMNNLESSNYYYFNDMYYNSLNKLNDNIFFANVYKDDILVAICMIFKYNKYLHYHLGGSLLEYRKYGSNNFLHYNVIKYGIDNNFNLYHLGAGVKENDSLSFFKKNISDIEFEYIIYKNILNNEIYNKITENIDKNINFFPLHLYKKD